MDQIKDIGPMLGILAFVGLAVLVFLLIQQAREVRRLREWAGRAPERAILIAERDAAERDAAEGEAEGVPGRLEGARERFSRGYAAVDRVSPIDPRFGLAFAAVAIAAVLVLTSVFGIFGGDGDGNERRARGGRVRSQRGPRGGAQRNGHADQPSGPRAGGQGRAQDQGRRLQARRDRERRQRAQVGRDVPPRARGGGGARSRPTSASCSGPSRRSG